MPAACCLVLLAAFGVQLAVPVRTEFPDVAAASPRHIAAAPAPLVGVYPAILSAPVFNPDRTPEGAAGAGVGASIDAFFAVGVVASPLVARAVVRGPDGASHSLAVGQELAGWRLSALNPHRLEFTHNGERKVLVVGAARAADASAANPAAPGAKPKPDDDSGDGQ